MLKAITKMLEGILIDSSVLTDGNVIELDLTKEKKREDHVNVLKKGLEKAGYNVRVFVDREQPGYYHIHYLREKK